MFKAEGYRLKFRYFFDAGSGVCLWADDDEARLRCDCVVGLDILPISEALCAAGERFIETWNTSIDWDDPASPSTWTDSKRAEFLRRSDAFHRALRNEPGSDFEVMNEVRG